MVRGIWMVISTMAVANLLALAGVVAWLQSSDRLSRDRIEQLRVLFSSTVEQDKAQAEQKARDEKVAQAAAAEAAKVGAPPLTAEQKLTAAAEQEEIEAQLARRVQRETSDLINTLMQERDELERQRASFQKEVETFTAMRKKIADEEGAEQFQKTVQLYQSVKAQEAKNMMSSLIKGGQLEQVVAYLNALPGRNASKIISEFQNEDPALAADLLERLRTRGTAINAPASAGGANAPVALAPEAR